ncbi:MAG TPA: hypothetical protein CFH83_05855 [Sulfuricurvum kujiense]|uniref:Uncharacterized protein n=1 Tax=Sulfuricurvum kujiense TaxID=148813 RepID=A0A2D3WEY5_9BACT|nr:hypothetical protein [Sulfuricurvum kujiense]DAB38465.1 MAG TPA: hypothetical protein CFH83_05855 [Sulfuricurvum kujiense]
MITSLLHPSPHTKIMVVTSHLDSMTEQLGAFLAPYEGLIDVSLFPGDHQNLTSFHKTFTIKDYKSPAGGIPRDYAAVIVQDVLHLHESPHKFLELLYRTLLNASEIIILQKNGSMSFPEVESLLDQVEFRAINAITDFIEGYDVIVAKKMHMWGKGL